MIYSTRRYPFIWQSDITCSVERGVDTLHWRHNGHDGVSNHQPHDCLLNRLFRYRSKKTSKLCATGLCTGKSPVTGEFPAQMVSNAENVCNWWRHHELLPFPWRWQQNENQTSQAVYLKFCLRTALGHSKQGAGLCPLCHMLMGWIGLAS